MEKIYNKLVRDNIPNIIRADNEIPIIRTLSDDEYKIELEKKLYEEYQELIDAIEGCDRIEELADILEIIQSLAVLENKTLEDIIEVARLKRLKKGGFKKKIFLEKVLDDVDVK